MKWMRQVQRVCLSSAVAAIIGCGLSGPNLLDPNYSDPEGRIAFVGTDGTGPFQIYLTRPDGRGTVNVVADQGGYTSLAWSSDARSIVFASNREAFGNFDIYVMKLEDRRVKKVVDLPGLQNSPAWSPDGRWIAFESEGEGLNRMDIFMIHVDGSGLRNLTDAPGIDSLPDWSPDGSQIAFQTQQGNNIDIFVMDAEGENRMRLTDFDGVKNAAPAWSPDGRWIVFASNAHQPIVQEGFPGYEIYRMDSDGTNRVRMTYESGTDRAFFSPTWSPDGQQIAFAERRKVGNGLKHRLMVMQADGADVQEIPISIEGTAPSWSPK